MADSLDRRKLAAIVRRMVPQAQLLRTWPLTGGVSAQVIGFEIALPDDVRAKLVLRRYGEADLQQDPYVAPHEFQLLLALHYAELPAPIPRFFDQSGEVLPAPYLVITYVESETVLAPADLGSHLQHMAAYLARLHALDLSELGLPFLQPADQRVAGRLDNRPDTLDTELHEGRIRDALAAAWPPAQRNDSVLLHGDFWPGNVLWKDDHIAAVVDWEDACVGDPLADLANARLEILWAYGMDAMQRFTEAYLAHKRMDTRDLPLWDLAAALRPIGRMEAWGLDAVTLAAMRKAHREFTARTLDAL